MWRVSSAPISCPPCWLTHSPRNPSLLFAMFRPGTSCTWQRLCQAKSSRCILWKLELNLHNPMPGPIFCCS
jgi:hypothetical protein